MWRIAAKRAILATGAEEKIPDVLVYAFDDSAKVFAYTVVSRDSTKDGAYLRTMSSGATTTLLNGRGDYKGLVFDRAGSQILFVANKDEFGRPQPRYTLYGASVKGGRYGASPSLTQLDEHGNLVATTDFRSLYATALQGWLGVDAEPLLGKGFAPLPVVSPAVS